MPVKRAFNTPDKSDTVDTSETPDSFKEDTNI